MTFLGRGRAHVIFTLTGFLAFTLGARPGWFGLERSAGVGLIQVSVLLIGLAITCLGGYLGLAALWGGSRRSIVADLGLRIVGTGYVIAAVGGLADILGLGSHPRPQPPYFGPEQAIIVTIGETVIAIGFLMFIPYHGRRLA